ncbi:MAG: hypothetical protein ACYS0G_06015 [Planctomycetota bacterium]|jgi:tetratricopeptide (TPR) repeat protein
MKPTPFSGLLLLLAVACAREQEAQPISRKPAEPITHKQTQTLTHEQARAFAERFEAAIHARDVVAIHRAHDMNSIFERAVRGMDLSADARQWFMDNHRRAFDPGGALAGVLRNGGSYTLLRVHEVEGRPRALFRMIDGQDRLRYHDYVLGSGPRGGAVIVDCEMLDQGESTSEVLRRHIEFALSDGRAGPTLDQAIDEIYALNNQRRYAEALGHWQRLDPSIRERKPLMSLRAFCAAHVNGEALDEAVRDYRRLFPDDPAADLVTNGMLRKTDRNDEFLEAIDRIRSAVGEDPYLDVLSSWGLADAGRLAEARDRVDAAVAAEPTLSQAQFTRLTIALKQKDYEAVAQTITAMDEVLGYPTPDLTKHEQFAGFVRSDAYRRWADSRTSRAQAE